VAVLDLISRVPLNSFVTLLSKQLKYCTLSHYFLSIARFIGADCLEILIIWVFFTLIFQAGDYRVEISAPYELQIAHSLFLEDHLRTLIEWIREDISLTLGLMVCGRTNTFSVVQSGEKWRTK
jgi:hypothetical protein